MICKPNENHLIFYNNGTSSGYQYDPKGGENTKRPIIQMNLANLNENDVTISLLFLAEAAAISDKIISKYSPEPFESLWDMVEKDHVQNFTWNYLGTYEEVQNYFKRWTVMFLRVINHGENPWSIKFRKSLQLTAWITETNFYQLFRIFPGHWSALLKIFVTDSNHEGSISFGTPKIISYLSLKSIVLLSPSLQPFVLRRTLLVVAKTSKLYS